MNLSDLGNTPGRVESITVEANYVANPLDAYNKLAGQHSILLESAEIDSKDDLKSLLLIDSALRIECNKNKVNITAISDNGAALLAYLADELVTHELLKVSQSEQTLLIVFAQADRDVDEDSRLKQSSVF